MAGTPVLVRALTGVWSVPPQARLRGKQWFSKTLGKRKMTQPSIALPQDSANKAKTIIEGVTVSWGGEGGRKGALGRSCDQQNNGCNFRE